MKAHNLTDVATSALTAAGLVNVPVKVGGVSIPAGGSADLDPRQVKEREIRRFQDLGAIHVGDEAPPAYRARVAHRVAMDKAAEAKAAADKKALEAGATVAPVAPGTPDEPHLSETKAEKKRRIKAEKQASGTAPEE